MVTFEWNENINKPSLTEKEKVACCWHGANKGASDQTLGEAVAE